MTDEQIGDAGSSLFAVSTADFRKKYEAPELIMEGYTSAEDVYWATNEEFSQVCGELAASETNRGLVNYFGVMGALDPSLSHLAAIHQPENGTEVNSAVLADINGYALVLGEAKLKLVDLVDSPEAYLSSILPCKIDFSEFDGITDEEVVWDTLRSRKFEYDPGNMHSALRAVGYTDVEAKQIVESAEMSDGSTMFIINREHNTVRLGVDIARLIAKALTSRHHWLSVHNPANFQKIKSLVSQNKIKLIQAPVQAIAQGELQDLYTQAGVGYVYMSNVNGFMGDADFTKMRGGLKDIGNKSGRKPKVIFTRYRKENNDKPGLINGMVDVDSINDSDMRPNMEKFPDLLS